MTLADDVGDPIELASSTVTLDRDQVSRLEAHVQSNQPLDVSVQMVLETDHGEVGITLGAPQSTATVPVEVAPPAPGDEVQVRFVQVRDAEPGSEWCLRGLSSTPGEGARPAVQVLTNQVGYLATGPKRAMVTGMGTTPVRWQLLDHAAGGTPVAEGRSTPVGTDPASGLYLHRVDFDEVTATGSSFSLRARGAESRSFGIGDDIYLDLLPQPVGLLYGNRSGTAIDDAYGSGQERPAGHLNEPPNQGDLEVSCLPWDNPAQGLYEQPWSCEGTVDASGGWYDAGDFGKYVTPGAVTTAQLLGTFERSDHWKDMGTLPAGAQSEVPDLLEEARWELDFLSRMQVTDGGEYDGMAYHKVTGTTWTSSDLLPHEDPAHRVVFRPSTQATLALAAVAAQASRVYRPYDPEYADALLATSLLSYESGLREPELYAPPQDDSINPDPGGGAYADDDARDELFWAAAELYLTTGEARFADTLRERADDESGSRLTDFYWANMEGFAVLQLARGAQDPDLRQMMQDRVVRMAERNLEETTASTWSIPYAPEGAVFAWGSTAIVLARAQVLSEAYELTGDRDYADGAASALDFVLGLNPQDRSYVTGWGEGAVQHPHGALFRGQEDRTVPPGTLVGGPNTRAVGTGDDAALGRLPGCIGLLCHLDESGSWSTNEPTIYGNAALVAALTLVHETSTAGSASR